MFKIVGKIVDKILGLFGKKLDNDKTKLENKRAEDDNNTEIKKAEIESPDKVVRRNKYIILMVIVIVIVLESFGLRQAFLRMLNIDPSVINFEKILTLFADILSSALVES